MKPSWTDEQETESRRFTQTRDLCAENYTRSSYSSFEPAKITVNAYSSLPTVLVKQKVSGPTKQLAIWTSKLDKLVSPFPNTRDNHRLVVVTGVEHFNVHVVLAGIDMLHLFTGWVEDL